MGGRDGGVPGAGRFAAVDVGYPPAGGARAALVLAAEPRFAVIEAEHTAVLDEVAPYRPGRFFERELPAVRAVLAGISGIAGIAGRTGIAGGTDLDLVVVDGYVHLDPDGRPGLGAHLHAELGVPVIGVAKTCFRAATHAVEVRRGEATRPLYVTAAGVDADQAADLVRDMAGRYRLPDALRRVDALSRSRV